MSKSLIIKIVNSLKETKKAVFTLEVFTRNKDYKFKIKSDSIAVQVFDKKTEVNELDLVNCELESVLPDGVYKIKSIKEEIFTLRNELYTSTYFNCLDNAQVFLPIFRVLGDQVVFIYKSPNGKLEKAFFINGRAFAFSRCDELLELNQTDLKKLLNNTTVINFEKLGRKYSYGSVFSIAEDYAKKNELTLSVKKFGYSCQ